MYKKDIEQLKIEVNMEVLAKFMEKAEPAWDFLVMQMQIKILFVLRTAMSGLELPKGINDTTRVSQNHQIR